SRPGIPGVSQSFLSRSRLKGVGTGYSLVFRGGKVGNEFPMPGGGCPLAAAVVATVGHDPGDRDQQPFQRRPGASLRPRCGAREEKRGKERKSRSSCARMAAGGRSERG